MCFILDEHAREPLDAEVFKVFSVMPPTYGEGGWGGLRNGNPYGYSRNPAWLESPINNNNPSFKEDLDVFAPGRWVLGRTRRENIVNSLIDPGGGEFVYWWRRNTGMQPSVLASAHRRSGVGIGDPRWHWRTVHGLYCFGTFEAARAYAHSLLRQNDTHALLVVRCTVRPSDWLHSARRDVLTNDDPMREARTYKALTPQEIVWCETPQTLSTPRPLPSYYIVMNQYFARCRARDEKELRRDPSSGNPQLYAYQQLAIESLLRKPRVTIP